MGPLHSHSAGSSHIYFQTVMHNNYIAIQIGAESKQLAGGQVVEGVCRKRLGEKRDIFSQSFGKQFRSFKGTFTLGVNTQVLTQD